MATTLEPLRVRLAEERHAVALAHELVGLATLDVHAQDGGWEVTIEGVKSESLVVRVLEAVRRTLADQPTASAQVLLDGHEYVMQGE
jgi:hypothetical protein